MKKFGLYSQGGLLAVFEYLRNLDYTKNSYWISITRIRCPKRHNRFMKMIEEARDRSNDSRSFKDYRKAVTFEAGFREFFVDFKGEVNEYPKSLEYANMDDEEFQDVHDKSLNVILQHGNLSNEDQEYIIRNYNVTPVKE